MPKERHLHLALWIRSERVNIFTNLTKTTWIFEQTVISHHSSYDSLYRKRSTFQEINKSVTHDSKTEHSVCTCYCHLGSDLFELIYLPPWTDHSLLEIPNCLWSFKLSTYPGMRLSYPVSLVENQNRTRTGPIVHYKCRHTMTLLWRCINDHKGRYMLLPNV